ncbi:hypothetical protein NX059_004403 [Plenodomus lindquistii]|nr:hypothetical protein NX059_004403 [Plenodomus lindquistii]
MPPRSILNKTPSAPSTNTSPGTKPPNPRHLDVAIHHATILEERKRVEAAVLDSIIMLMDFPVTPDADAKRPSASDAQLFIENVKAFQPADYDALIEERNIGGKCGYALCSKPKQKAPSTARKQFVDTDHGVEIVDRKVLEVWCSDDCAKRALYVKVQLKEEPAWLRQGGYGDNIELMVDNIDEHRVALPLRLNKESKAPDTDDDDDVAAAWAAQEEAMADLALERGEQPGQLSKASNALVKDEVMERATSNVPPTSPTLLAQNIENTTMAIEGHVPRLDRRRADEDDDEDEDDAQDWDKHLPG